MDGLEQVRTTMGTEAQCGFSDQVIKDALYEYWYDVQQTVEYLLGELGSLLIFPLSLV